MKCQKYSTDRIDQRTNSNLYQQRKNISDHDQKPSIMSDRWFLTKGFLFFSLAFLVIILDQITKLLIVKNFELFESIPLTRSFLSLTYIQNTGAGWGILQGQSTALIWLSIVVIGFILFYYDKIKTQFETVFVSLILGGTIGNLIDRLRFGFVVDFIDFRIWPAFNIADSALTVGVIGLLVYFLIEEKKNKEKKK